MLHLIYGLSGTGKTTHLIEKIKQDVKRQRKTFLIVPEQQTVETERIMSSLLPPSAQLSFEVVNFTRLANKVFRIYGGLSYHYISGGMKELLMWQTLKALTPLLKEYNNRMATDPTMPSLMLSAIGECKAYDVSPIALERAAVALPEGQALKNKLSDLSMIYATYESMVNESYDDNSEDLTKLADLLEEKNFFEDCHVYIDSFTDFTAQELRVIRCILAQANEVYVSLLSGGPDVKDLYLSSTHETSLRLRSLGGDKTQITVLDQFHRFSAPELTQIARHLWHFHIREKAKDDAADSSNALTLLHCSDAYSEAKAAVSNILSLVQEHGYRFRDIALVTRNAEGYRGILDTALEKADIPFFMSEKTDLSAKPLISLIFSALAIKWKNYRTADVMSYIKTGLSGFTPYEIDVLESYTATWRIQGAQFTKGDWEMNPDGYTEAISARGKKILETANSVRQRLVASLEPFFEALDRAKTAHELCDALYQFLRTLEVDKLLLSYAARALDEGDKKEAAETAGTFKAVFDVLSDIVSAIGDEEMSLEDFMTALRIVLKKTEIGTIPTAADQVMIGSASMLRAGNIRCAILLGLCEGEFPMRVSEKGLFSDTDRSALEGLGITLSGKSTNDAANELLYVYRAMTMPSDKLVLIYRDKQLSGKGGCAPSLAFRRVCELFPSIKIVSFDTLSPKNSLYDKASAFDALPTLKDASCAHSLYALLSKDERYQKRMSILTEEISKPFCHLQESTANLLFGKNLSLTQTQIEKYVSCHFSYYCTHILKLRETKRASFDYSNIGTFIHKILELFVKETGKDTIDADRDAEKIRQIIRREISEQSHLFIPKSKESEGRILHLLLRFYRLASLVAVNICREQQYSKFVSKLYEAEFGTNSKHGLEAPHFVLEDGCVVSFGGKVDRIDTYRKDGKMYVRVVDYKTGHKTFSADDIKEGYSIQLLLYLFAICDNKSEQFRRLIGCEKNDVLSPAGAVYLSMAVPRLARKPGDSEESTLTEAAKKIKRSGILLNNADTLSAMSSQLDSHVLAGIKFSAKDGTPSGNALVDAETFSLLRNELTQTICRIAKEIKSGNASAHPKDHNGVSACTYCSMKPFCRVDKLKESQKKETEETT